ncbi:hypothetical protein [Virgisporangium aurantiacum]|uniref:UDP-N-acetylglucosamine:LPS N-acetylglucosamine transferase n=1 Tax=Virgisporangium aurantiacum TaxID=175570 RepID=A0A8J4DZM1_9ACTN|nr:hypothetical protein [Virgisporangium aurantiacum]GIJ55708.1 hypothetical protein Vau01_032240 [Virgisporangium aurantiacum]
MIACYAAGGGLGHLTRVRAFLHAMRPGRDAVILTSSPHAGDPRVVGPHRTVKVPPGASYLTALAELAPTELIVDAFPGGLYGELTPSALPASIRTTTHLARLLQWTRYRAVATRPLPRYDQTWTVEPLTGEHHADLAAVSTAMAPLDLVDPRPADVPALDGDAWLIVHSGPAAEVAELIAYAEETAAAEGLPPSSRRLVLVAPPGIEDPRVRRLDVYPAWPLFARASRIITAAGCNAVRQAAPWRDRHRMIPFPRLFDDQFTRAARARR